MPRGNVDALLEKLSLIMDVDLSLGAEGYALVQVDERIDLELSFDEDTQSLVLVATCGTLPEVPGPLMRQVLEANFHWTGSGGGTLALNPFDNRLFLQFSEPVQHLDQDRLQSLLNAIVQNASYWNDRLEAAGAVKPTDTSTVAPDSTLPDGHVIRV